MTFDTDSLDSPLFLFEGPSDPNPGSPHPVTRELWEEYKRLLRDRDKAGPPGELPNRDGGQSG
ncbi:MAG TPA: hypothetical protein VKD90_20890 [Gemmataceae bacterium]|nr:hypothetical protein [Gemmataceae bacterium]